MSDNLGMRTGCILTYFSKMIACILEKRTVTVLNTSSSEVVSSILLDTVCFNMEFRNFLFWHHNPTFCPEQPTKQNRFY